MCKAFFFRFCRIHKKIYKAYVIKPDVYRKHMAQNNHKGRQDAYKSSEEVGFNSVQKEKVEGFEFRRMGLEA